jgi:hypothetical protein
MNQTKIELRKVRDFGGLLNVIFEYIKINFKSLLKSNLLISAPAILLAGVFMGLYQSSMFNFTDYPDLALIGIPFVLSMLFIIISYLIVMVVTYSHLIVYNESETGVFEMEDVWLKIKQIFFMILNTEIGYFLLLFLVGIFPIGIGFYLVVQGYEFFFLLMIFGTVFNIYLGINYSLVFIVRIQERLKFFEALSRSKKLISGNWWFTFGLIIVVWIIQGFLGSILLMPNYIVTFFVAFTGVDSESSGINRTLYIISSIISSLSVLIYSISTIAIAFQYYNLVERKEAPGLLQKVENIN